MPVRAQLHAVVLLAADAGFERGGVDVRTTSRQHFRDGAHPLHRRRPRSGHGGVGLTGVVLDLDTRVAPATLVGLTTVPSLLPPLAASTNPATAVTSASSRGPGRISAKPLRCSTPAPPSPSAPGQRLQLLANREHDPGVVAVASRAVQVSCSRPDGSPMVTAASSPSSRRIAGRSAATVMPFATDRNPGPEPTGCRSDGRLANPRLRAPMTVASIGTRNRRPGLTVGYRRSYSSPAKGRRRGSDR